VGLAAADGGWRIRDGHRSGEAVGLAERHVSRQLRLAYLALGVLKRLVNKREVPAVTLLKLTDVAALPWHEQPERVFD
jgi:hypothetical protein